MMPFPLVALSKNRSDANFKATKIYFSATKQPLPFTTEHLLIQTCSIKATDLLVQSCKKFLPQKVRSSFVEHCGAGKVDVCIKLPPFFFSSFFFFFLHTLQTTTTKQCSNSHPTIPSGKSLICSATNISSCNSKMVSTTTYSVTVNNTTKHSLFQQFLQQYNN